MSIENLKQGISQYVEEKRKIKKQKNENKKHIISILFSTYTDWASRVVALTSGFGLANVVSVLVNITTIFTSAVMSFTGGEKSIKVYKNLFYIYNSIIIIFSFINY